MVSCEENDRGEIIDCVVEFYQLISGSCTDKRNWSEFSKLFAKNATLSTIKNGNEDNIITISVQDYITKLSEFLENRNFWERGSDFQVATSKRIAYLSGTYEASTERGFRTAMKSGTNFIQLVKIKNKWRIFSMLWEDDA